MPQTAPFPDGRMGVLGWLQLQPFFPEKALLLGFLGVLSPKQKGPTAADVPATTATPEPAASALKKK